MSLPFSWPISMILRPPKRGEAADDRLILAEIAVAAERHEIVEQRVDIILEVRPLGMARDLGLLPRRQRGIGARAAARRSCLEPLDLGGDVDVAALGGRAQFGDARFELRDGFSKSR